MKSENPAVLRYNKLIKKRYEKPIKIAISVQIIKIISFAPNCDVAGEPVSSEF